MELAGLDVRIDEVGNLIGRLAGEDPTAPVIVTGSHIDTVVNAGIFDGALGVLAAIESLATIHTLQIKLKHPIEVISFTDEEGTRFGSGFIGSKTMVGQLTEEELTLEDDGGISYAEAFSKAGFEPSQFFKAIKQSDEIKAFIELHIEQGRVLEEKALGIGIVTHIQGMIWLEVTIKGLADHAGTTPMSLRKDASLAMAEVLLEIEVIALLHKGVATVGKMKFLPNSANSIPQEIQFTVDFRHADAEILMQMKLDIMQVLQKATDKRQLDMSAEVREEEPPYTCSPLIIHNLEQSCQHLGLPYQLMNSGAGHDAGLMSRITPMGLLFVRSQAGISHHPDEWSTKEDCCLGATVLLHTLLRLAK
jgi:allantoate deiminase